MLLELLIILFAFVAVLILFILNFPSFFFLYFFNFVVREPDSAVGTATGYGLDDRGVGVRVQVASRISSSPRRPDLLLGPPNLLPNGYRGLFPRGVKRPGREADHSPPASAEVKKMWINTFTAPCVFMASA
jgi:hypothetical protein